LSTPIETFYCYARIKFSSGTPGTRLGMRRWQVHFILSTNVFDE